METITRQEFLEVARWTATLVIPALAGLAGVIIGALLTSRRERKSRQVQFLEKQLSSFYSPMLGLGNEIRAHSAFRNQISQKANTAWQQLCADTAQFPIYEQQRLTEKRGPEFSKITVRF